MSNVETLRAVLDGWRRIPISQQLPDDLVRLLWGTWIAADMAIVNAWINRGETPEVILAKVVPLARGEFASLCRVGFDVWRGAQWIAATCPGTALSIDQVALIAFAGWKGGNRRR